jgi:hypothetical protein
MNLVYSLINHVFCHNPRCIFYIMIIFDISLYQMYIISFCKYAIYQLTYFSFGVVSLIHTFEKVPRLSDYQQGKCMRLQVNVLGLAEV